MPRTSLPAARRSFALTGPSRPVDRRVEAVRDDLADARLADRVFAPHYAEPVRRCLSTAAALLDRRGPGAETLAMLAPGNAFDLLDVTGGCAWGIAVAEGLVGYIPVAALAADAPA
jgi:hypothetical protein